MSRLAWWLVVGALAGCPTQFTGDPMFPGGVAGCRAKCSRQGLVMGAFVYSGEYSTSCVCRIPSAPTPEPGAAPASEPEATATPMTDDEIQDEAAAAAATAASAAYQQQKKRQQQQQ